MTTRIVLMFLLLFSATTLYADPPEVPYRHEFKLGIGAYPSPPGGYKNDYGLNYEFSFSIIDFQDRNSRGNLYTTGCFTGSYGYQFTKWFQLGCALSYTRLWQQYRNRRASSTYVSMIPFMQFTWANFTRTRFYSSIGLGIDFIRKKNISPDKNGSTTDLATQVTFVGMSIGRTWFGFAELGVGDQGIIKAGIGYRFQ